VDILENGPPGEPSHGPFAGRRGRLLIGALIVAVLVAIGVSEVHRRNPTASPAPTRSAATPAVVGALVGTGSSTSYQTSKATNDFVLQVDLINYNRTPVRVQAAAPSDHPGFDRLAAAVLPGDHERLPTGYGAVAAAAGSSVTLGWGRKAQLTLAGRVACGTAMINDNTADILVDGMQTTVTIPDLNEGGWAETVTRDVC
jgi:hypothetical protein